MREAETREEGDVWEYNLPAPILQNSGSMPQAICLRVHQHCIWLARYQVFGLERTRYSASLREWRGGFARALLSSSAPGSRPGPSLDAAPMEGRTLPGSVGPPSRSIDGRRKQKIPIYRCPLYSHDILCPLVQETPQHSQQIMTGSTPSLPSKKVGNAWSRGIFKPKPVADRSN